MPAYKDVGLERKMMRRGAFSFRNIGKKLNNKAGMSLMETLCALIIVVLAALGIMMGISTAVRSYEKTIRQSEAQVLFSTLQSVIGNELAYSTDITVDSLNAGNEGNVVSFSAGNFDIECTIKSDDSGENGFGKLYFINEQTQEKVELLGSKAYTHGLMAKADVRYHAGSPASDGGNEYYFTVDLSIGYKGEEYYRDTFQVFNVNRTAPTEV